MSGGRFDYKQYNIDYIVDEIEHIIRNNNIPDEWGGAYDFSPETIDEFRKAVCVLKQAAVYAQRVDWLVSGDDGEASFHKRLKEDLEKLLSK